MASDLDQICMDKPEANEQGECIVALQLDPSKTPNKEKDALNLTTNAGEDLLTSSISFHRKTITHWVVLFASSVAILLGLAVASLLGRLYFIHGGSRRWLFTWVQTVAWPISLPLLIVCYQQQSIRPTPLTLKLFFVYVVMGIILALDNLLYSWGISYLPVSTNALLTSSQLAFTAVFAFGFLKKRITPFSLNSVFVITIGAVLLGVHANSDRPAGTTEKQYVLGFVVTIAGAALYAIYLILTELVYDKVVGRANFIVALEIQTWISASATLFSMVGMWIVGDFTAIPREAKNYELGRQVYIFVLVGTAIGWQVFFLGSAAIIFLTSSLMACVFTTTTFPLVPILAVIFFHENFSALKAISMLMTLWGFISYTYGGYMEIKERNKS